MRKVENEKADELRAEYQRSDFGELKRGKYAARILEESNVVVLDPDVAAAFPNDKTVDEALRGLLKIIRATHPTHHAS